MARGASRLEAVARHAVRGVIHLAVTRHRHGFAGPVTSEFANQAGEPVALRGADRIHRQQARQRRCIAGAQLVAERALESRRQRRRAVDHEVVQQSLDAPREMLDGGDLRAVRLR